MGLDIKKLRHNEGSAPEFAGRTEEDDKRTQSGCLEPPTKLEASIPRIKV
jgi:hypothetical protein